MNDVGLVNESTSPVQVVGGENQNGWWPGAHCRSTGIPVRSCHLRRSQRKELRLPLHYISTLSRSSMSFVRDSDLALALLLLPRFVDTILMQVRITTTNDDQSSSGF